MDEHPYPQIIRDCEDIVDFFEKQLAGECEPHRAYLFEKMLDGWRERLNLARSTHDPTTLAQIRSYIDQHPESLSPLQDGPPSGELGPA